MESAGVLSDAENLGPGDASEARGGADDAPSIPEAIPAAGAEGMAPPPAAPAPAPKPPPLPSPAGSTTCRTCSFLLWMGAPPAVPQPASSSSSAAGRSGRRAVGAPPRVLPGGGLVGSQPGGQIGEGAAGLWPASSSASSSSGPEGLAPAAGAARRGRRRGGVRGRRRGEGLPPGPDGDEVVVLVEGGEGIAPAPTALRSLRAGVGAGPVPPVLHGDGGGGGLETLAPPARAEAAGACGAHGFGFFPLLVGPGNPGRWEMPEGEGNDGSVLWLTSLAAGWICGQLGARVRSSILRGSPTNNTS